MPSDTQLYVPFSAVTKATVKTSDGIERPARIVRGVMTDETLDLDEQVIDYAWASKAAEQWFSSFGNIRQQHNPNLAVGKGQKLELDEGKHSITLTAKIIDPDAILKVDEGVLSGYSVGIKGARVIEDAGAPGGRIVGGHFIETSIVDHPANPSCKFLVAKAAGKGVQITPGLLADEDLTKDASWNQTPTLTGSEAQHNGPLQTAQAAIRTLIAQEAAENEDEWSCIAQLAAIGDCLRDYAYGEAQEEAADASASDELAVSVLMAARLEDRAERVTSIHNIAKALSAAKETTPPMPDEIRPDEVAADKAAEPEASAPEATEEKAAEPSQAVEEPAAEEDPEKGAEPDVAKDTMPGQPATGVSIGAVIDWALANGMPKSLLGGLLAYAGTDAGSPPTSGAQPQGTAGSFITDGTADTINPPSLVGMKSVSIEDVREVVTDTLQKFITSDTFLTKLAEAGEAKVAAAEATDVAKAAATDLTSKVADVEGQVSDLRKSLTAEIDRIKALPQAPKAVTGALPQGVHVVEKAFDSNSTAAGDGSPEVPELADLIRRATAGDYKAALQVQKAFAAAGGQKVSEDVLRATYAAAPRAA